MELNWKKGNYEVRTTTGVNGQPYVELIKMLDHDGRRTCITLAYFHKDSDGYVTLRFVGDRPFTEIAGLDINEVWRELWLSMWMLEGNEDE